MIHKLLVFQEVNMFLYTSATNTTVTWDSGKNVTKSHFWGMHTIHLQLVHPGCPVFFIWISYIHLSRPLKSVACEKQEEVWYGLLFTSADVVFIVENMLIQHVFVLSSVNSCYSWCLCGHVTRILLVTVTPHLWCSVARRIDLLLATTGIYHSVIILSGAPACLRLQGVKQSSRNCRVYCFLWYLYACIFVNITLD